MKRNDYDKWNCIATINRGTAACGDLDEYVSFLFHPEMEQIFFSYDSGYNEPEVTPYKGGMSPMQIKEFVDNSSFHEVYDFMCKHIRKY